MMLRRGALFHEAARRRRRFECLARDIFAAGFPEAKIGIDDCSIDYRPPFR